MPLETILERSLSILGYPTATHGLADRYLDGTALDVAPSARIAAGCLLRGRVDVGPHARLSRGCVLGGDVTVGRRTNLEPNCSLVGDVELGNYCAIARQTCFQQTGHRTSKPSQQIRLYEEVLDAELPPSGDEPITVGNDVWTGLRSTVLAGVTIGDGAVVGAGSVVTDDVEPYAIVAGVPADRIGWRFPRDVRAELLDLEWWEWDEATIRERRAFFERDLEQAADVVDAVGIGDRR
ncbi:CatB-related O-acetyltransferase [Natronolimnohabitans innermongolicus]|uniref:Acetyltransferase (Isoleucine patch superfamily)-like protein n=1 Tax=Natronolimnohabitans innermongolicus JCM 12255 TaxID=1227499 RepID=L9XAK1_9EURY|nr:CatB-related O-acetyltransferase [Natronolimnohabitans innermongolicus]ELY58662.1 acetyltransferase (isoleucine patch superfamily)-like protein [Natronolimnohabitans innermongolicus JCM 12255]